MFFWYQNFSPDFFNRVGKQLEKKAKVNISVYDVTIAIHIFLNISRKKGNKTIKFFSVDRI